MNVIQTRDPRLARKARLALFRGVIASFESEGATIIGAVHSITQLGREDGVRWKITIKHKTERAAPVLRRYNPRHRI
jgi:hypothetical protein